ncbi:MAG: HAD family hydrolase [Candidatus Bipolaricaulia bacterium]
MKIELVSFDADGTIVKDSYVNKFWFEELPKLFAEKKGVGFAEARETLKNYYDEVGDKDLRWYKPGYWFKRFDIEKEPEEVIEKIQVPENVGYYGDALEITEKLSGDYRLIVTSNAPRIFLDYALKKIESRFSEIFSCVTDFGKVKKNAKVYQKVLDQLDVKPGQVVHVGDHWVFDYKVPRKLGINTFYIDRTGDGDPDEDGVLTDLRDMNPVLSPFPENQGEIQKQ